MEYKHTGSMLILFNIMSQGETIMKRILSCLLCILMFSTCFITACGKKKSELKNPIEITESYYCVPFQIPNKEGFDADIANVLPDEQGFCVIVLYTDKKNDISFTDIMTVNEKGEIERILELSGIQIPTVSLSTEYAFLGVSNTDLSGEKVAVFLDRQTGNLTKTVTPEFQADFIVPTSDGFVIAGLDKIAKYNYSGECQSIIQTKFTISKNSFFEDNGKYYVIGDDEQEIFYALDFANGTTSEVATLRELEIVNSDGTGKYYFAAQGVNTIDLKNMQVTQIISWNDVDLRPPTKGLVDKQYYPVDDQKFALKYIYGENDSELLLVAKDESFKPVVKEKITIGGCLVYQDLPLQWLVYQFNTTNSEYRVVLDEYARFYAGSDTNELRRGQLNLMQYFNDGNSPDIFYGNTFDFEYMGRTGMVADLKPYLEQSQDSLNLLTDAAKRLMINGDGSCYQVFASYWLNGNIGCTSHFPEGSSISLSELEQKSQELGIPSYEGMDSNASGIVCVAILYNFPEIWGVYDGSKKITVEDLKNILDVAVSTQDAYGSGSVSASYQDALANDLALLDGGIISDIYSFAGEENSIRQRITFVGNPGIDGSVHVARPSCRLAMSATTAHPDKCWELMSGIFSEKVQKITACSGMCEIPVNQYVLNEICEAAMEPDSVTDEVLKSFVKSEYPVSQENVNDYIQAVNTADALYIENRSLMFMVSDEVNSYYTQNRSAEQIARTLYERLELYAQENYS